MFISSNYLFVSGEHRVHFNTNVCSRFCCTPRPFQAYGYPLLLLYLGGLVFILVFRQECAPLQRCTLRLSVLWHNSIGSLFLSTCTTTWQSLFGFLPVPCVHCCGFRDYGTPQRSTHVCNRILQASSTSANNPLGQTRQYSWQVNELACFSGPFVPCFFLGISWQYDSAPSTLLSGAVASAMIPTGQAEKTLKRRESPISCA